MHHCKKLNWQITSTKAFHELEEFITNGQFISIKEIKDLVERMEREVVEKVINEHR